MLYVFLFTSTNNNNNSQPFNNYISKTLDDKKEHKFEKHQKLENVSEKSIIF